MKNVKKNRKQGFSIREKLNSVTFVSIGFSSLSFFYNPARNNNSNRTCLLYVMSIGLLRPLILFVLYVMGFFKSVYLFFFRVRGDFNLCPLHELFIIFFYIFSNHPVMCETSALNSTENKKPLSRACFSYYIYR